jgi:hypothetical protein
VTTDTNHQRVDELIRMERQVTLRDRPAKLDCDHSAVKKWVQQYTPEIFQRGFKSWI